MLYFMGLELSITTDYKKVPGNPKQYLKRISEAGFTHVHWCHEWNTDHLYSDAEIDDISRWLNKYGLKLLDLHASEGKEINWISSDESKRKSGVDLVKNRIHMTNRLSGSTIILHFDRESDESDNESYWGILHKSLDELEPFAREHGVRIALENYRNEDSKEIKRLLSEYDSNFLGLCYDSGHGNVGNGLEILKTMADRLISIHLHDNDGISDQHKLMFSGTINWDRLAGILAASSYSGCISLEVNMRNHQGMKQKLFLSKAYESGVKLTNMVKKHVNNI